VKKVKNDFPNWLMQEMEKRGWNQSELAEKAGMTPTAISDVLKGKRNPGLQFCKGVARAFDVTLGEVLRHANIAPPIPPKDAWVEEMTYMLLNMPPEYREAAEVVIKAFRNKEKKGKK
jgi:transcriptional regulator with XRE-family HTH domain